MENNQKIPLYIKQMDKARAYNETLTEDQAAAEFSRLFALHADISEVERELREIELLPTPLPSERAEKNRQLADAQQRLADLKSALITPSTVESSSGTIESGEPPIWIEKAKAIAQRTGTEYWRSGQRQITSRNIAGVVATELAKDMSTYGLQGQRGEDNVRNVGLKGWVFTPPSEAQSVD